MADVTRETSAAAHAAHAHTPASQVSLTIGSVGVVYGDIGTSPLYAFREAILAAVGTGAGHARNRARRAVADPVVARSVVVTIKYVLILLRADNNGEGGTLSLTALASRALGRRTAGRLCARHDRRGDVLRRLRDHAGDLGAVGGRRPQARDTRVRAFRGAADGRYPGAAVRRAVARHGTGSPPSSGRS